MGCAWGHSHVLWYRAKGQRAGGEGATEDEMASLIQWRRVWANSGWSWRTGKPGVLQSVGSQRVGRDWASEQQQRGKAWWPSSLTEQTTSPFCDSVSSSIKGAQQQFASHRVVEIKWVTECAALRKWLAHFSTLSTVIVNISVNLVQQGHNNHCKKFFKCK